MNLSQPNYGKAKVRVLKVVREKDRHWLKELEISISLQGNFHDAFTQGDNRLVVPADTLKNAIHILAKERLGAGNEDFGIVVGQHFLAYEQVAQVQARLTERSWQRMRVQGRPHPHSFVAGGGARPVVEVRASREEFILRSGIEDLLILKTAEAGFEGFARDQHTTLAETRDNLLATKLQASWLYRHEPANYSESNAKILDAMIEVFAATYSPSPQRTLFQMGEAALNVVPEISEVQLKFPIEHFQLIDLAPLGFENPGELYLPAGEPFDHVEGTVVRDDSPAPAAEPDAV
jgi:urate oxidase